MYVCVYVFFWMQYCEQGSAGLGVCICACDTASKLWGRTQQAVIVPFRPHLLPHTDKHTLPITLSTSSPRHRGTTACVKALLHAGSHTLLDAGVQWRGAQQSSSPVKPHHINSYEITTDALTLSRSLSLCPNSIFGAKQRLGAQMLPPPRGVCKTTGCVWTTALLSNVLPFPQR